MFLNELKENQTAIIKKIDLEKSIKETLFTMGVYVGGEITYVRSAPFKDPLEYIACGNYIALRKHEAKSIEVEVLR